MKDCRLLVVSNARTGEWDCMGYMVVEQDILLEMETPRKCTLRSREYLRGVEKYFV